MTSPELLRDKLASLKWHLTEGTVNREIIFGLIDECQALTRAPSTVGVEDDPLDNLVARFAKRLLAKLKLARANGRSGWERDDWEAQCQEGLLRHLEKGDPRDVAAYCAFMDHHGWVTKAPNLASEKEGGRSVQADSSASATECDHRSTEKAALPRYVTAAAREAAIEAIADLETNTRFDSDSYTLAQHMMRFAANSSGQVIANQENLSRCEPEPSSSPTSLIAKGEGE